VLQLVADPGATRVNVEVSPLTGSASAGWSPTSARPLCERTTGLEPDGESLSLW